MAKLHWADEDRGESGLYVTACGDLMPIVAKLPDEVTCKKCRRALELNPPTDRTAAFVEGLYSQPIPVPRPSRDPLTEQVGQLIEEATGLPVLRPETYARRDCHCASADCPICHFFARLEREEFIAPWQKRSARADPDPCRFGSLNAALRFYVRIAEVGVPVFGTPSANLIRLAAVGTRIQGGAPVAIAEDTIADFVDVERAIASAYADESWRIGIPACVRVLLLHAVGQPTRQKGGRIAWITVAPDVLGAQVDRTEKEIRSIVRHGRKAIRQDLRGRGMVAP